MDNPFDSKNEDALKDAFLADGWQRYAPYTPLRVFGRSGCPERKRPSLFFDTSTFPRGDRLGRRASGSRPRPGAQSGQWSSPFSDPLLPIWADIDDLRGRFQCGSDLRPWPQPIDPRDPLPRRLQSRGEVDVDLRNGVRRRVVCNPADAEASGAGECASRGPGPDKHGPAPRISIAISCSNLR